MDPSFVPLEKREEKVRFVLYEKNLELNQSLQDPGKKGSPIYTGDPSGGPSPQQNMPLYGSEEFKQ